MYNLKAFNKNSPSNAFPQNTAIIGVIVYSLHPQEEGVLLICSNNPAQSLPPKSWTTETHCGINDQFIQ